MNLPCGVASNQNVGNFRSVILPVSTRYMIFPPSTELRASLSGCQAKIPEASPLYTVYHLRKYWSTRNFGSLLLDECVYDINLLLSGELAQFGELVGRLLTCRSLSSVDFLV